MLMVGFFVFGAVELVRLGIKLTKLAPKVQDLAIRGAAFWIGCTFGYFLTITPEPMHWGYGVSAGAGGAFLASFLVAQYRDLVKAVREAVVAWIGSVRSGRDR
jgi:hypothetical protein